MHRFLHELSAACVALELRGRRVLLAVSGGADSVAMLRGLLALRPRFDLDLHVAHLDHGLRPESAGDAAWLGELCGRLELPFRCETVDVSEAVADGGRGLEETARKVRYEFFQRQAGKSEAADVLLAHTADDQAETILHHIVRGTGLAGLHGMPLTRPLERNIRLARPLLEIRRELARQYLAEIGQDFREDSTNIDERFTRNRLRHTLLPLLASEFNPGIVAALLRLGAQAAGAQEILAEAAGKLLSQAMEYQSSDECRLRIDMLSGNPRHLVRECFATLWTQQGWPRQKMGFDQWEQLAVLALGGGGCELPAGFTAWREGRLLIISRCSADLASQ